jgi:hypothetical protein
MLTRNFVLEAYPTAKKAVSSMRSLASKWSNLSTTSESATIMKGSVAIGGLRG